MYERLLISHNELMEAHENMRYQKEIFEEFADCDDDECAEYDDVVVAAVVAVVAAIAADDDDDDDDDGCIFSPRCN